MNALAYSVICDQSHLTGRIESAGRVYARYGLIVITSIMFPYRAFPKRSGILFILKNNVKRCFASKVDKDDMEKGLAVSESNQKKGKLHNKSHFTWVYKQ